MRIPLFVIRAVFFLCSVGIGSYLAKVVGREGGADQLLYMGVAAGLATVVIATEVFFSTSPIALVSAIVFGIIIGFLVAWIFTGLIEVVAEPPPQLLSGIRLILTLVCVYFGITLILQTKDDFKFIIPYVEFSREIRGTRPLILDTSALVDGRLADVAATGLFDMPVLVPRFVVDELHALADSQDKVKRARGRRGLDVLKALKDGKAVAVEILEREVAKAAPPGAAGGGEGTAGVDAKLVALSKELGGRIITTDGGLCQVAALQGVVAVSMHDLARALQARAVAGDRLTLKVIKPGEGQDQGVGYLEDGTMIVVEKGRSRVGQEVTVEVTGKIQTSAGRMFFAKLAS